MASKVAIICVTLVVMFLIAVTVGVYLARRQERMRAREQGQPLKGDLTRDQEQALLSLLDDAAQIMRMLGVNTDNNFSDPEIIRSDTKISVGLWLAHYNKAKERVSK